MKTENQLRSRIGNPFIKLLLVALVTMIGFSSCVVRERAYGSHYIPGHYVPGYYHEHWVPGHWS
jgi:hypothetical protein